MTAIYSGDSLHDSVTTSITQSVNKAHLTVIADSKIRLYGAPNPTLTDRLTGYVNGDTAAVVSGSPALSTTATTSSPIGTYPITVTAGTLAAANYDFPTLVNGVLTVGIAPSNDYTGSGRSEPALFRRTNATIAQWFVQGSAALNGHSFGAGSLDVPLTGDFDGDGKTDLALYRPSTAQWFVSESGSGYANKLLTTFGEANVNVPMPGNYNGTGTSTTVAVYRPPTGQWFIQGQSTVVVVTAPLGGRHPGARQLRQHRQGRARHLPAEHQQVVHRRPRWCLYDCLRRLEGHPRPWLVRCARRPATRRSNRRCGGRPPASTSSAARRAPAPSSSRWATSPSPAITTGSAKPRRRSTAPAPASGSWSARTTSTPRVVASYGGSADTPTAAPYTYRALKSGGGLISKFSIETPVVVDLGATAHSFATNAPPVSNSNSARQTSAAAARVRHARQARAEAEAARLRAAAAHHHLHWRHGHSVRLRARHEVVVVNRL